MKSLRGRTGRRHHRSGFTLMEVLLVLAILGVLMAMVVPGLLGQQKQANIDATKVSIHNLEQALKLYALNHDGEFPSSGDGLQALINAPAGDNKWRGPYLDKGKLPDDAWGNPLQYSYPGQHNANSPDISSWGPDKTAGTDDDITNWSNN